MEYSNLRYISKCLGICQQTGWTMKTSNYFSGLGSVGGISVSRLSLKDLKFHYISKLLQVLRLTTNWLRSTHLSKRDREDQYRWRVPRNKGKALCLLWLKNSILMQWVLILAGNQVINWYYLMIKMIKIPIAVNHFLRKFLK